MSYALPKKSFLISEEYAVIFKDHGKIHANCFTLLFKNITGPNKLGISVAKKNVNLSVKRSLCKRMIRETFRLNQHTFSNKMIIVLVKKNAASASKTELRENLIMLWKKLAAQS